MEMQIVGFLVSLVLWTILVFLALKGALILYREKALSERWLLIVPFLFASLVFYGIRYRFSTWFLDRQAVHELFSVGAFWEADRLTFILCFPILYGISVLKPEWVVRTTTNLSFLMFLPFALKLILVLTGVVHWEQHAVQMMPTRLD